MKQCLSLIVVAFSLAGCGADGEPVRPTAGASVTVTPDGIHTGASVGVVKGPISVLLSL